MHGAKLRRRIVRGVALAWAVAALTCRAAAAGDTTNANNAGATTPSLPDALRQLTDTGGWRTRLGQAGVQFTFTYYGDAFANPTGGVQQGFGYDGRFGVIVDADLEKLLGWSGAAFHASIHQIHGTQYSAANLQNLAVVSGVEAPPSTRLFNLWIEQKLGSDVNLRVGQFTAAQEFLVSQTAALFVNSTFGWPVLPAQDLPSGGPAYPEATPGVRLAWTPDGAFTLRAAVFNGDPAGPGAGNPVMRDPFGLAFRLNDPPLLIAELAYAYNQSGSQSGSGAEGNPNQEGEGPAQRHRQRGRGGGLPGTIKIGGWLHSGQFPDQRFNDLGGLLAAAPGVPPLLHSGDAALYGVIDQMLWHAAGGDDSRELNGFLRAVATPADRNLVDLYVDGGASFTGLFAARPSDVVGLGLSYSRISPQASAADRDVAALTGMPVPIRDYEAALELTYQMQLAANWSLQPDLQYIVHPGGHVVDPRDPSGIVAIPNALVLGVRTMLKF
jgi:porin